LHRYSDNQRGRNQHYTDEINITLDLDSICQSIWFDTLQFSPLGGQWMGQGIVDSLQGIFAPELAPAGDVELTYLIYGCSQTFTVFVKEIRIGGPYQTSCPSESPLVMYEDAPIPTGGYWEGTGIANANSGLYDPSLIPNDSWTSIIYYALDYLLCSQWLFRYHFHI